jgi:hypothetical protein
MGCSSDKKPEKIEKKELITIKNHHLIYPKNKTILLFSDNSEESLAQKDVLDKLNLKYHEINSTKLKSFFNIKYYPTIIILDKNKTIKYEKFIPYEMLKMEKSIKD